jgi:hypothetical protein
MKPFVTAITLIVNVLVQGIMRLATVQLHLFAACCGSTRRHAVVWVGMLYTVMMQAWVVRYLTHGEYAFAATSAILAAIVMIVAEAWEAAAVRGNWFWPLGWQVGEGKFRSMILRTMPGSSPGAAGSQGAGQGLSGTTSRGEQVVSGKRLVSANALARLLSRSIDKNDLSTALRFGGIPFPRYLEVLGLLLLGAPGSGKSVAIRNALVSVRARREPAMVADSKGGFLEAFYGDGDYILNPFDLRSAGWNPFKEIRTPYDCSKLAKSAIPDGKAGTSDATWCRFAQTTMTAALKKLVKDGNHSISELRRIMFQADREELAELLEGTDAAIMTQEGGEKALQNMRVTALPFMEAWEYLPDGGDFSITEWVESVDAGNDRWLFMPYTPDQKPILKFLISTWMDLALGAGMTLPENPARRLWYVMDELDSLGKLNTLVEALTNLRKHGGCPILGIQTISQLKETYGENSAQTIRDSVVNKVIMRAGGEATADDFSKELGRPEILRLSATSGKSRHNQEFTSSSNTNTNTATVQSPLVTPDELRSLPINHGYLMLGDRLEVAAISQQYVKFKQAAQPFEPNYQNAQLAHKAASSAEGVAA